MSDLLCCPFCGGAAEMESDVKQYPGGEFTYYWVWCRNDDCYMEDMKTLDYDDPVMAAERWNTRAP